MPTPAGKRRGAEMTALREWSVEADALVLVHQRIVAGENPVFSSFLRFCSVLFVAGWTLESLRCGEARLWQIRDGLAGITVRQVWAGSMCLFFETHPGILRFKIAKEMLFSEGAGQNERETD